MSVQCIPLSTHALCGRRAISPQGRGTVHLSHSGNTKILDLSYLLVPVRWVTVSCNIPPHWPQAALRPPTFFSSLRLPISSGKIQICSMNSLTLNFLNFQWRYCKLVSKTSYPWQNFPQEFRDPWTKTPFWELTTSCQEVPWKASEAKPPWQEWWGHCRVTWANTYCISYGKGLGKGTEACMDEKKGDFFLIMPKYPFL